MIGFVDVNLFSSISGAFRKRNTSNKVSLKNSTTEKTQTVVSKKLTEVIGLERVTIDGRSYDTSKLLIDKDLNVYAPTKENRQKMYGLFGSRVKQFSKTSIKNALWEVSFFEESIKGDKKIASKNLASLRNKYDVEMLFANQGPFDTCTFQ